MLGEQACGGFSLFPDRASTKSFLDSIRAPLGGGRDEKSEKNVFFPRGKL